MPNEIFLVVKFRIISAVIDLNKSPPHQWNVAQVEITQNYFDN